MLSYSERLVRHRSYIALLFSGRIMFLVGGLIVPLDWSPGTAELFPVNAYLPSLVEWGVALGVLGYALMPMSLGLRYLPLFSSHDPHDSVDAP